MAEPTGVATLLGGGGERQVCERRPHFPTDVVQERTIRSTLHFGRGRSGECDGAFALALGEPADISIREHAESTHGEGCLEVDLSRSLIHQNEIQVCIPLSLQIRPENQCRERETLNLLQTTFNMVECEILTGELEGSSSRLDCNSLILLRNGGRSQSQHDGQRDGATSNRFHGLHLLAGQHSDSPTMALSVTGRT